MKVKRVNVLEQSEDLFRDAALSFLERNDSLKTDVIKCEDTRDTSSQAPMNFG